MSYICKTSRIQWWISRSRPFYIFISFIIIALVHQKHNFFPTFQTVSSQPCCSPGLSQMRGDRNDSHHCHWSVSVPLLLNTLSLLSWEVVSGPQINAQIGKSKVLLQSSFKSWHGRGGGGGDFPKKLWVIKIIKMSVVLLRLLWCQGL